MWIVRSTGTVLGLQDIPAVSLALFHTIFNVLGVIVMWPLTNRLASYLRTRFATEAERLARPQYLDRNVMAAPVLAMEALCLELNRVTGLVRDLAVDAINAEGRTDRAFAEQEHGIRALIDAVEQFVIELEIEQLPASQKGNLPIALRITGYLEETVGLVRDLDDHRVDIETIMQPPVREPIATYQAAIVEQIRLGDQIEDLGISVLEEGYEDLQSQWHELKTELLNASAARSIPIRPLNSSLEGLRSYLKMAEQLTKAAERTHTLGLTEKKSEDSEDLEQNVA
jgi:phosphate:Na+ symporter